MQFNENARRCGAIEGDFFKANGDLNLPKRTGKEMRELVKVFPLILSGVLDEEQSWLLELTIHWRNLSRLARTVNVNQRGAVIELEELVARVKPLFLRLYQHYKEDPMANLDGHPTYHMLDHLVSTVDMLGDLNDVATDYFEHCHVSLKEIFVSNTNHSRNAEDLMPQVMRAWGVRLLKPEHVLKERGVVEPRVLGVQLIGQGTRRTLGNALRNYEDAFAGQVRPTFAV